MIPTEQASGLIKKLHQEMNTIGKYNTYIIAEDVEHPSKIFMTVHTASCETTQEEKLSFVQLTDKIKPYFINRTKDFKEKSKPTKQAPIKSLHMDKLIGQLVVVNIPNVDNKSLNLSPEYLTEQMKKALESVLLEGKAEICTDKGTSQKGHPYNTPQN